MVAVANPYLLGAVEEIDRIRQESAFVPVRGTEDSSRSDLLSGTDGTFDWATLQPVTAISSCLDDDNRILALEVTFGENLEAETFKIGTRTGLISCEKISLEPGDCITYIAVDGAQAVGRLLIETRLGYDYTVGGSSEVLDRWDTAT